MNYRRKKYNTQENRRQGEELLTNEKISNSFVGSRIEDATKHRLEGRKGEEQVFTEVSLKLSSESEGGILSMGNGKQAENSL